MTFVYKACQYSIVTLQLLPDSVTNESRKEVVNSDYAKFRTNKAKVIKLVNPLTKESLDQDISLYDSFFIYKKGEIVSTYFDSSPDKVCGKGIHYFKTYKAALSWYYYNNCCYTTGTYIGCWDNGQKRCERTYKNGKLDGPRRGWYDSSQLKYEETCKNGELDGSGRGWYESGLPEYEGTYKNGYPDGTWRDWYESGQIKSERTYKHGNLDGTWKSWNESGQMEFEGTYKNGSRRWKQWPGKI